MWYTFGRKGLFFHGTPPGDEDTLPVPGGSFLSPIVYTKYDTLPPWAGAWSVTLLKCTWRAPRRPQIKATSVLRWRNRCPSRPPKHCMKAVLNGTILAIGIAHGCSSGHGVFLGCQKDTMSDVLIQTSSARSSS